MLYNSTENLRNQKSFDYQYSWERFPELQNIIIYSEAEFTKEGTYTLFRVFLSDQLLARDPALQTLASKALTKHKQIICLKLHLYSRAFSENKKNQVTYANFVQIKLMYKGTILKFY